jgi:hypothetical protein
MRKEASKTLFWRFVVMLVDIDAERGEVPTLLEEFS